ncbi:MAG: ribonuclease HII [Candidatus Enteromonas sp.]|nr:ribonuclease HII [Candidatus Enteromonas sp.]MDY6094221.1 ribonuclease HII [Candidatus Enteromonas sp.]
MLDFENEFYSDEVTAIVGVDEAGRGPLAGPVCAAAVILPRAYANPLINDSKQLTAKKRDQLFDEIKERALAYGIAMVSADEIDELNIYAATQKCMKMAIAQLKVSYQLILTDAMPLSGLPAPVVPIIKGDAKAECIAAASILAKVTRDRYMEELELRYPAFSFGVHKGYGTKKHMEELERFGPIDGVHRKTYAPVRRFYVEQLKLFED